MQPPYYFYGGRKVPEKLYKLYRKGLLQLSKTGMHQCFLSINGKDSVIPSRYPSEIKAVMKQLKQTYSGEIIAWT